MEIAWANLLLAIGSSILAALAASGGLRWSISRRCYKLELQLLDLQNVVASMKGRDAADKRWGREKIIEDEIKKLKPPVKAAERQFANDFFETEEHRGLPR